MQAKNIVAVISLLSIAAVSKAQSYTDSISQYRAQYKQEFITDKNSPLHSADTAYLRFYAPDEAYKVNAFVHLSNDSPPFKMKTHSGKEKMYRKYGELHFKLKGKKAMLEIYQSISLMKNEAYKDYLFIPFNDLTNYETTYAGGRYLDISIKDIKNGAVQLDFNKCYNPYCAFASGYSCPIPPDANKLKLRIEAGEMNFAGAVKE